MEIPISRVDRGRPLGGNPLSVTARAGGFASVRTLRSVG